MLECSRLSSPSPISFLLTLPLSSTSILALPAMPQHPFECILVHIKFVNDATIKPIFQGRKKDHFHSSEPKNTNIFCIIGTTSNLIFSLIVAKYALSSFHACFTRLCVLSLYSKVLQWKEGWGKCYFGGENLAYSGNLGLDFREPAKYCNRKIDGFGL